MSGHETPNPRESRWKQNGFLNIFSLARARECLFGNNSRSYLKNIEFPFLRRRIDTTLVLLRRRYSRASIRREIFTRTVWKTVGLRRDIFVRVKNNTRLIRADQIYVRVILRPRHFSSRLRLLKSERYLKKLPNDFTDNDSF